MAPRTRGETPEDAAARVAAEQAAKAESAKQEATKLAMAATQAPAPVMPYASAPTLGSMSAIDQATLLAKNQAAARAQAEAAQKAAEEQRTREMLLGSQSELAPSAAQMADAARFAGSAASSMAPGMGAAPGTTTPDGAAADAARMEGAARASAEQKPKQAVQSAAAVVSAPPNRVQEVIDKLKTEEAKGGPGIFDIIEAAAAGWHGRVPLYTQKALEAAANEERLKQIQQTAQLQAGIEADQQAEAYKRQKALEDARIASQERIAGIGGANTIPGLSPITQRYLPTISGGK